MDGYTILAGFLLFFLLFIYATWFGFSIKIENKPSTKIPNALATFLKIGDSERVIYARILPKY